MHRSLLRAAPLSALVLAASCFICARATDTAAASIQIEAVYGLIARVLGKKVQLNVRDTFALELRPSSDASRFEVHTSKVGEEFVRVRLVGTDGVALASAFRHYCFNHLNVSVTWGYEGTGRHVGADLSQPLPTVPHGGVSMTSQATYRYYMNYCTTSYSWAFASLEQWLDEVDWMAFHGINTPLAAAGAEAALASAYGPSGLGLSEEELLDFFPGAAFLAWNRMANMDGPFGGPLTKAWRERRAQTSRQVFDRMRAFGMQPVLQGFSGHVPCALQRIFPDMKMSPRPHWNGFNSTCLLDPSDTAYFEKIGRAFYEAQAELYGESHLYATDQWNEMEPPQDSTPQYLAAQSAAVYRTMAAFDDSAKWVMQAWFLVSLSMCEKGAGGCGIFWARHATPRASGGREYPLARAYLEGVPRGGLLMLDLQADLFPVYPLIDNFYGHDFVWSAIHNFGRKTGMYGDLAGASQGPPRAASAAPSFRGIGLAMEGVHQNPVYYELITEMVWLSSAPDVAGKWVPQYAAARYGSEALSADVLEAWRAMTDPSVGGVYTSSFDTSSSGIINRKAGFILGGAQPDATPPGHNATTECAVWGALLRGALSCPPARLPSTLRYDLVDSTRQSLDNLLWDVSRLLEGAFARRDLRGVRDVAAAWRGVAQALDEVLNSDRNFMLGPWIADAVATAADPRDSLQRHVLEYNARNQITLWGPTPGTGLEDYARKMWGGLVGSYYLRGRWGILLEALEASAESGRFSPADVGSAGAATRAFELRWQTNFSEAFPTAELADAASTSAAAWGRFADPALASRLFEARGDADVPEVGLALLPQPTWTRSVGSMAFLCSVDAACGGFTSHGHLLKRFGGSDVRPTAGVTLYSRRLPAEGLFV